MVLENRVAIVSGGASGIGEEICLQFAAEGARVGIVDINGEGAREVCKKIESRGSKAIALVADICDYAAVAQAAGRALETWGSIDILVNCAGFNRFLPPHEVDSKFWEKLRSINLDGAWNLCRAVMETMMKQRSGKIINIGSASAVLGIPKAVAYTAAKHGLVGLTRALAVDLGPYGINVNCICPATVLTPLLEKSVSENFKEQMRQRMPLGRLGKPADVAQAALFLASPASDWITGVVLPVDGGLVCCVRAHHYE